MKELADKIRLSNCIEMKRKAEQIRGKTSYTFKISMGIIKIEQDNIIHVVSIGQVDDSRVDEIYEIYQKIMSLTQGTLNILVDLNNANKSSPYARKMYTKMSENNRIGKIALFGIHPVARVLASFVAGKTKKNKTVFFTTEEDALLWIKQ